MMFPKPLRRVRRKGHKDPVSADTVSAVLVRDRGCVAAQIDPDHECRSALGYPHRWDDLAQMTMEHVKDQPRLGVRAPSDIGHLIALYHAANLYWGPTHREEERAWIAAHPR